MKKLVFLAASALLIPALSRAQDVLVRTQPEPDFEAVVSRTLQAMAPQDAFSQAAECRVVDAKFFAPVSLDDAQKMLAPCMNALSSHYGMSVQAKSGTPNVEGEMSVQVEELLLKVPASAPVTSPLLRDLNHGLSLRGNRILGQKALVDRGADERTQSAASEAQDALDHCMLPQVLRRIDSGDDFIKYYGGCLRHDDALRVVALQSWPGHQLGVIVLTQGGDVVAEGMTGPVQVTGENGPVKVDLVAYTQPSAQ